MPADESSAESAAQPSGSHRPRPRRSALRLIGRGLVVVAVVTVSLLVGVLLVVRFAPADVLRRAALPIARQALHHDDLHLGRLRLQLGARGVIELRDLWLGPPRGFSRPLASIRRIVLRYDARRALQGEIAVEQLQVERPVVWVERRAGQRNWEAFIAGLAGKPEKKEPEPAGKPPQLTIDIERAAVIGLAAYVDDGPRKLDVDAIDLAARGRYHVGENDGAIELATDLRPRAKRRGNLSIALRDPEPVEAELASRLELRVGLRGITPLRGHVQLAVDVRSKRLESRWPIEPIDLGLRLDAGVDQTADEAVLRKLTLRLGEQQLLAAHAAVTSALHDPHLDMNVERVFLPLDTLAGYARAFVSGLAAGGQIEVKNLQLVGPLGHPESVRPAVRGEIVLTDVSAQMKQQRRGHRARTLFSARGLSGRLLLRAPQPDEQRPPPLPRLMLRELPVPPSDPHSATVVSDASVLLLGRLQLGRAVASGARIERLDLRVAAGANLGGLAPTGFASRLSLAIGRATYRHPELGLVRSGLHTKLAAFGDLTRGDITVAELELAAADTLRAALEAKVERFGKGDIAAELHVEPIRIARAVRRLPAGLRRKLPLHKARGRIGLDAEISGRIPRRIGSPLRLPLRLAATLDLRRVGGRVDLAKTDGGEPIDVGLERASGKIKLGGRPDDLRISTALSAERVLYDALGLTLHDLRPELSLRVRPGGVQGRFAVGIARSVQREGVFRAENRQVHLKGTLKARLPLEGLIAGRPGRLGETRVQLRAKLASTQVQQAGTVQSAAKGVDLHATIRHRGHRGDPLEARIAGSLTSGRLADFGLGVRDARFSFDGELDDGLELALPAPILTLDEIAGIAHARGRAATVTLDQAAGMKRRLRGVQLAFDARRRADGPLQLEQLVARVASHDAHVKLWGTVAKPGPLIGDPQRELARGLPAFELHINGALGKPRGPKRALLPGLATRGKVGLTLSIAQLDRKKLSISGRIVAHRFHVWRKSGRRLEEQQLDARATREYRQTIHLANLNADIPFSQQLHMTIDPPRIKVPPPRRSIFRGTASLPTYRAMRLFAARRGNITFDRVGLTERIVERRAGRERQLWSRELKVGKLVGDLSIEDSTVKLSQLYLHLFDGDVLGAVHAQLRSVEPPNVWAKIDTRVTGVDFGYLDPAAKVKGNTKLSALIHGKYRLKQQRVSGRIVLTDISREALDRMLAYLDPRKLNKSVQQLRGNLTGFSANLINPEPEKVEVTVDHGKLNLDLSMGFPWKGSWWQQSVRALLYPVVGPMTAVIGWNVRNNPVRRLSIKRFLPKGKDDGQKSSPGDRKSATRRRGRWRLRKR